MPYLSTPAGKENFAFQISTTLLDEIRTIAREEDRSIGSVIRAALRNLLDERNIDRQPGEKAKTPV